jgi:hypothetical protein
MHNAPIISVPTWLTGAQGFLQWSTNCFDLVCQSLVLLIANAFQCFTIDMVVFSCEL